MYNSEKDTLAHKSIVARIGGSYTADLNHRILTHDDSKLQSPEKECYDKYVPLLKETKYGTPEYEAVVKEMRANGGTHHGEVNPHHPEFHPNGISDMNILDLTEMLIDWYSASLRSDTSFAEGLKANQRRFGFSDDLLKLFTNSIPLLQECNRNSK